MPHASHLLISPHTRRLVEHAKKLSETLMKRKANKLYDASPLRRSPAESNFALKHAQHPQPPSSRLTAPTPRPPLTQVSRSDTRANGTHLRPALAHHSPLNASSSSSCPAQPPSVWSRLCTSPQASDTRHVLICKASGPN